MKIYKTLRKRGLALFLALTMCLSLIQTTAFATEQTGHTHNEGGWICTQAEPTRELTCKHEHTADCYVPGEPVLNCEDSHHTEACYTPGEDVLNCEEDHEHTEECYVPGEPVLTCVEEAHHTEECYVPGEDVLNCTHEHTEECYTVTEGEWTCVPPEMEEVPEEVQKFLDVAALIPEDINVYNAEEAGELVNAAFDAYEALVDAGLDEYEGVAEALAKVEAAYMAVEEALELGSSTMGLVSGNYGGFVYTPRGEFSPTDGTHICVQKWDFNNPKHPYEYYNYLSYWYDKGSTQYAEYLPYATKSDSSCFERCQNFIDRGSFMPQVLAPRTVEAGKTAVFGYLVTTTDYSTGQGLGSQVPSVYLYDVVDVTQGEEYIDGGRDGLRFYASEDRGLQGLWPYVSPNNPHIRMDTPIKADAPNGATIQIRFRLAYGFEDAWWGNHDGYKQSDDSGHRANNYYWYVEDFVYTLRVGEGGDPDEPTADVTAYHDLYIPAGYSTTMVLSKAYDRNHQRAYELSNASYKQGDSNVASVTKNEFGYQQGNLGNNLAVYDNVTIQAAADAEVGDTTTLYVTYHGEYATYQLNYYTWEYDRVVQASNDFMDVINVHIVAPQDVKLDLTTNKTQTIDPQGSSADGTLSSSDVVFRGVENGKNLTANSNRIAATSLTATRNSRTEAVTLTAKADGSATIEHQYHRYDDNKGYDVYYDELAWYVDVINVTVGNPVGDDPDSIDGLDIKKEVDKTSVVGGDTLTYTITVKNDSSVDKPVTVTDELPYGIDYDKVSFDTTAGGDPKLGGDYGWTVIWTPTVPAKGTAVLKITCEVENPDRSGHLNNKATLESADGNTKDSLTVTTQVTPKRTKTVIIVKTFIGMGSNKLTAEQVPTDFQLDYSYTYGGKTTTGSLKVDKATKGTNENSHPTLTWALDVPVDQDKSSTSKTPLTVTEVNYNNVAGYTWEKQSGLNSSDEKAVTGTYEIDATENLPTNNINNYYSKNPTPSLSIDKELTTTPVKVGQNVTYIITVTNSGTADAINVTVSDPLNTEYLKFVSYQINNGEVQTTEPAKSLYPIGTVTKSGGTATLKITAEVLKTDAEGKLPANTAYLNPTDPDNPGGNGGNEGTSTVAPTPADKLALTGITKALVTEENKKTLNVPETILSTEGITIPKTAQISLRGDNSSSAKLLYKITVTGDVGAKYKVTELGNGKQISGDTLPEGIALVSGALSGTIPGAGSVDIYVTMVVTADDIDGSGNVKNVAKLASGETSTTGAPGEGEGKDTGTSSTPGVKVYTVTVVRYIPDPNKPGEFIKIEDEQTYVELPDGTKYVLQSQQGNGRARSKGVLLSAAEEPPVSIPFVKTFEYEGQWYSYDDPVTRAKNEGQGVEEGTVDGENVTVKLYYDLDMKGTIGTDGEGIPTDTTDGTPDKYQAKVIYTATDGGTQTGVTTYATITDETGNMATEGTISIAGATASANEGNHFTKWTAEATGHDSWTYEESTNATLAADDSITAKGGAEYTFTANFEANSGAPLSVSADNVIVIYDGQPHPVTPTANKAGAAFTVVYKDAAGNVITGAPVDAGEYTAEITATLDGKNATYTAKVTINKRQLNVTTGSDSKVYDGTPLTNATATVTVSGGEVSGEHITATATGSQTEVGESKNTYTMDWGSAKEGNYQITEFLGTLTVTEARALSVTAPNVTTTYDGEEHPVAPVVTVGGAVVNNADVTVTYTDASGNSVSVPVNAGDYTAHITAAVDGRTVEDTATVTISRRQLTITTGSNSKQYDGTPLTDGRWSQEGLQGSDSILVTVTGTRTEVGASDNTFTYAFTSGLASNYDVVVRPGTLRVTARPTTPPTDPYYPPYNPGTPGTTIPDATTPLDPGTDINDQDVPLAGTVGLNDTDHFAYVIGYDEDHVRPLANITRAEAATIFFRLMEDDFRQANWATTNSFTDVKEGDWYNNAVSTCARAGILKGREDGRFDPNATITRAEFAVMAARFLDGSQTDDGTGDFSDTASHWAAKEIRLAAKAGWITGSGNKFEPNAYITRAQVMLIVNRMLDRTPDADHMLPEMKKWSDNPEGTWYYEAVQEATNEHDYTRDETNVETWTALKEGTDWAALELGWAANNGASASGTETETQGLPDGI